MNKPIILNGKKVAEELYSKLPNINGKELSIITIGDDDASKVYVRNKIKACEKVGLKGVNYKLNSLKEGILLVERLNNDDNVVGIMIQKPLPKEYEVLFTMIDFYKDVDCSKLESFSQVMSGFMEGWLPPTPKGILTLLDYYDIPIEGKNVVIIGRSNIVGKPLAAMMLARNATVTLCHSKTKNLRESLIHADIIISAIGKPKFIDKDFLSSFHFKDFTEEELSDNPVIIDVGINRDENGKLCGDVDFDDVLPYVSAITPVPGGVGPMTVYSLIENCCKNN